MIKAAAAVLIAAMTFVGCAAAQDKYDRYTAKRDAVAHKVEVVKAKKDCQVKCTQDFRVGIDRANCRAQCTKSK